MPTVLVACYKEGWSNSGGWLGGLGSKWNPGWLIKACDLMVLLNLVEKWLIFTSHGPPHGTSA